MSDDPRLLAKVATLYYKNQLSQHEIAQRLAISRQTAGRLLQRARDTGIVRVEIMSPVSYETEIECRLEEAFHLREAIVITPAAETEEAIKRGIGQAAADFLRRRLQDGDVLGIVSGSTTLYECVLQLKPMRLNQLRVVGLNGSVNRQTPLSVTENIIHRVAGTLNGQPIVLTAPAFVDRPEIKASLLGDSSLAPVLALARQARVALFGIGDFSENSSPYREGFVSGDTLRAIRARGGIGEICGHGYDLDGRLCAPEISERTIGIELAHLREIPLAVALAGGTRKADAIYGALRGKYCNVLITDAETARALLKQQQARHR
ncbi:MAG: sugar-binding transcriptional regulator [Anaerolineae bacterium]|jgi:deoxyribonucleoside regulator|nr:sugar-binding transcriptional regulator [Anaerolineae bacterium]